MLKRVCLLLLVAACGREQADVPDATERPPEPITVPGPPVDVRLDDARGVLRQGDVARARGLLERLALEAPTDAGVWTALGAARLAAGDPQAAIEAARRATTLDPKNAEGYVTGAAAFRAAGDTDGAIKALERALVLDPALASTYWNLAGIYSERNALDKEALVLDALLKEHPDDIQARFVRASNALKQKDPALAKRLTLEVVERTPTHMPAQRMLAALAWDAADYREAFERARITLRLEETDNAAQKLLESAFYVLAAAELACKVGPRPWTQDQAPAVLTAFAAREGLDGAFVFGEIDAELGGVPEVQARVEAVRVKQCP